MIRNLRERKQGDSLCIALCRHTDHRANVSGRSFYDLCPDEPRIARLGQRRRLKQTTVQRIEGIMTGEVTLLAPREELIISSLKKIAHLIFVNHVALSLTDVSMRLGVSTKLS